MTGAQSDPRTSVRILMVEHTGWGGVYHYAHRLSEALTARGHEVRLVTGRHAELDQAHVAYGSDLAFNSRRTSPWRVIRALACRPAADVVHLHLASHAELYVLMQPILWFAQHCPVVVSLHEIRAKEQEPWKTPLHRIVCRLASRVLVHGPGMASRASTRLRLDERKLHPLGPFFGDFAFFRGIAKESVSRTPYPSLLQFGLMEYRKGLEDLIAAFALVLEQEPSCRLTMAGKPYMPPDVLRAAAARHGVTEQIRFDFRYIPADEVSPLFEQAWLTVLPYREAEQSGVLFLAFGHQCPVVATRCGSLPDVLIAGRHGELVPPANPRALAATILELVRDPARLARYRANIETDCQQVFTWERLATQVEDVYLQVLGLARDTRGPQSKRHAS